MFRSGDADALGQRTGPALVPAVARQSLGSSLDQGCQQRAVHCVLPSLNQDRYTLTAPGAPARTLLVQAGGESSCRFTLSDGGVQ